jgi:polysaccharide export outer membrane protein
MKRYLKTLVLLVPLFCGTVAWLQAQPSQPAISDGTLGPEDLITIRVLDIEEFSAQNLAPVRVDPEGNIRLPLVGRTHVAGLTVGQLEAKITKDLSSVMNNPEVTVTVAEYGSRPVSVLGSVRNPGVHQVSGHKTLYEVLSLAGGLSPDASNSIKITRRVASGPLPLAGAARDVAGEFYVGTLNVRSVMEARDPSVNIAVLPNDVITVPKAEMVYVIGAVKRPGGFILNEKEQMSVLQALSLAEGLERVAASKSARILRQDEAGAKRSEIPVNVRGILEGGAQDVAMHANDILFVPESKAKNAGMRALEVAIQTGTGVVIWRH